MMPCRVLLVEDDASIGPLLAETLTGLGYEVCGVEATEAGAVAAAARCRPDLMIMDVNLAEGTGTSAMERIMQVAPVPHVFISGRVLQRPVPGAVLLTKPFRVPALLQAIGRALAPGSPT